MSSPRKTPWMKLALLGASMGTIFAVIGIAYVRTESSGGFSTNQKSPTKAAAVPDSDATDALVPHGTYRVRQHMEGRVTDEAVRGGLFPYAPVLDLEAEVSATNEGTGTLFALTPREISFRQAPTAESVDFGRVGASYWARATLAPWRLETSAGWPVPISGAAADLVSLVLRGTPVEEAGKEWRIEERKVEACKDEAHALCRLEIRYSWESLGASEAVLARSTATLLLERTGAVPALSQKGAATLVDAREAATADEEILFARNTLGDDTLESLRAALEILPEGDGGARARLARKFHALALLQPGTAGALADLIRGSKADSFERLAITGALAESGTPEAQRALMDLIGDQTLAVSLRATVVGSLHGVKTPTSETLRQLQATRQKETEPDLRSMQGLLVGTLAGRLPPSEEGVKEETLGGLRQALADADRPTRARFVLAQLGNSADVSVKDAILRRFADADASVRAAAARALRQIPGEDVDTALAARFPTEEPTVQQAIIEGLSFRAPKSDLVRSVASAARRSPEHAVRREMILALVKWDRDGLPVKDELTRFMASEKSGSLRKLASLEN